nr:zinc-binding dehydrogenase [Mycolicibacter kumamotonensis]
MGCAVVTGVGAAINTASIRPGDAVAVIGCGGIGLSIIQGARVAGAGRIIGVDPAAERRAAALRLGATDTVDPVEFVTLLDQVNGGDGADHVFEAAGRGGTIRDAFDATRKGGEIIVVGAGSMDDEVSFSAFELFYYEKTLKGCFYGSSDARTDFDRLLELWRTHQLDLEGLVSDRLSIDDINYGLERMREVVGVRQLVVYDL